MGSSIPISAANHDASQEIQCEKEPRTVGTNSESKDLKTYHPRYPLQDIQRTKKGCFKKETAFFNSKIHLKDLMLSQQRCNPSKLNLDVLPIAFVLALQL